LRAAIAADGLVEVGEPRLARFDPPFKPWFLRRNEVQIDVAE
jgi:SOUL heme-binding protein.